eukprot:785198-Rhodomonas_salina.1
MDGPPENAKTYPQKDLLVGPEAFVPVLSDAAETRLPARSSGSFLLGRRIPQPCAVRGRCPVEDGPMPCP